MGRAEEIDPPSQWLSRWVELIPKSGPVLDVACGGGRNTRLLVQQGFLVEAIDRDLSAVQDLRGNPQVQLTCADLEANAWPYTGRTFAGVVVVNYLHRALFPELLAALAPDAIFLYETFAAGNEKYGKPSNPNFLLQPGELLEAVRGRARVIAYEDLYVERPKPAMVQRICARRAR